MPVAEIEQNGGGLADQPLAVLQEGRGEGRRRRVCGWTGGQARLEDQRQRYGAALLFDRETMAVGRARVRSRLESKFKKCD